MKRKVTFDEPPLKHQKTTNEAVSGLNDNGLGLSAVEISQLDDKEIKMLRNFKKEQADDMEALNYLESAKTKVFETNSRFDEDEAESFERFTSVNEETKNCLRDPVSKHQNSLRKQQEETEDFWYNQYLENQERGENRDILSNFAKLERESKKVKKPDASNSMLMMDSEDASEDVGKLNILDLLRRIVDVLKEKETVTSALRRFGGMSNTKNKNRNKRNASTTTGSVNTELVDRLTALADACMAKGFSVTLCKDIYIFPRERLLDEIGTLVGKRESLFKAAESGNEETMWEYKPSFDSTTIFGPFSSEQMHGWQQEGYFAQAPVRKVGQTNFVSAETIDFTK